MLNHKIALNDISLIADSKKVNFFKQDKEEVYLVLPDLENR